MNAIVFEERRGRSQKSTACSKGISSDLLGENRRKKETMSYPICSVVAVLGAVALRDVHHVRTTYVETNDISRQYNDKIIMYSDRFRYHIIISET